MEKVINLEKYKYNKVIDYYCIDLKKCRESKCTKSSCNVNLKPSFTCAFHNRNCLATILLAFTKGENINEIIKFCINKLNINNQDLILYPAEEMLKLAGEEFKELWDCLFNYNSPTQLTRSNCCQQFP